MSRLSPPPVVQQPPERMLTPRRSPRRPPTAMGPALQSHGSMVSSESPAVGTPVVGTRQSTSAFAASETLAMPQPPSRTGTIRSSPCVGQSAPRHSLEEDEEQQPPTDDSQGTANRQGSRHAPGLKRTSLTVEQQVKIIKRHESSGIDNKLTYAQLQAWAKEEFHLDAPLREAWLQRLSRTRSLSSPGLLTRSSWGESVSGLLQPCKPNWNPVSYNGCTIMTQPMGVECRLRTTCLLNR